MPGRTLISDAVLVNPKIPPVVVDRGWLAIDRDRILAVGKGAPPSEHAHAADLHVCARGGILLPGLVNTHTHAAMSIFRGMADDLPLMDWLERIIFPAEARAVNQDFVYWGTLLSCAEMIQSGTTSFANGYFFEQMACEAVGMARMRAILAQGVVDFPTPCCPDPAKNLERAAEFLAESPGSRLQKRGIFCHSPYTCSPETLSKAKELCRLHQAPYFIHAAETRRELDEVISRYGTTPLRHLDGIGVLDETTVLVHGVWVDSEEIGLIASRKAGVSICTESQMKLASGIAPLNGYLKSGVRVGLGTDGPASNNDLDLFGEMDLTAKLHKVNCMDPTALDAATVLHLATRGGALLLGWDDVGLLEPGYKADLILLVADRPHLRPLYHPVSQLVYSARGADVRMVWIDGEMVMKDRALCTLDIGDILENIKRLKSGIH